MRYFTLFLIACLALTALAHGQSAIIVKQVKLLSQTDLIKPTILITPKNDSLYRVSVYLDVVPGTNVVAAYWLTFGWTDTTGIVTKQVKVCSVKDCDAPESSQSSFIVSDLAGSPLGYTTTANRQPPLPAPYNVYITVEQLQ